MADNVAITAGSGTTIAADEVTDGTLGSVKVQYMKVMDGTIDGTNKLIVDSSGNAQVKLISGAVASGAIASGAVASGAFAAGSIAAGAIAAGASSIAKAEDAASADADVGIPAMAVRKSAPANTSGADGDYEMLQMQGGRLYVRGEPRTFSAVGSTLTRPANTTAYSQNDSVSNNGTAGSVTAQSVTVADTNDDPIIVTRIKLDSTDTGFGGKSVRVYVFNSDPTTSSGVGGGDNAAWSQKKAGVIGTYSGTMRAYSDGAVGFLAPDEGVYAVATPTSGAKTLYWLLQITDAAGATPSANSTTFIATFEGIQGRA